MSQLEDRILSALHIYDSFIMSQFEGRILRVGDRIFSEMDRILFAKDRIDFAEDRIVYV